MGWTKDPSAILVLRRRLVAVRAELRDLVGVFNGPKARIRATHLLREYESLSSALAYGNCDGRIQAELGVTSGYKPKDLGCLVYELLEEGPTNYTFQEKS